MPKACGEIEQRSDSEWQSANVGLAWMAPPPPPPAPAARRIRSAGAAGLACGVRACGAGGDAAATRRAACPPQGPPLPPAGASWPMSPPPWPRPARMIPLLPPWAVLPVSVKRHKPQARARGDANPRAGAWGLWQRPADTLLPFGAGVRSSSVSVTPALALGACGKGRPIHLLPLLPFAADVRSWRVSVSAGSSPS